LSYSPGSAATGFLLFAGLALFTSSAPAAAQAVHPLTDAQVDCEATQLRAILGRSAILFGPGYDDRAAMFLFSYGSEDGHLAGLGLMEQHDIEGSPAGPERQIAFAVEPSDAKLLRNPSRPRLNTMYLIRDRPSSDLSKLEDSHAMAVVVDPTNDPLHNQDPFSLLIINNLTDEEGGTAADAKVGRGLQGIFNQCTHAFTRADLHVFSVLARTLRFTAWDPESSGGRVHKLVSIYRGAAAEPISGGVRASYRIDVLPVLPNQDLGRVSLEMQIDLADDGTLGEAHLRTLPACAAAGQLHCSSAVARVDASVIKPVYGDQRWSLPAPTVCWKGASGCVSEVSFSFGERLQGTTWLHP
jgi:hypothetical protein